MDCDDAKSLLVDRTSSTWILDLRTGEYREAVIKPQDIEQQVGDRRTTVRGYYRVTNPPRDLGEVVSNIAVLKAIYDGSIYSCGAHTVDEVLQPAWLFQSLVEHGLFQPDPTPLLTQLYPADKLNLATAAIRALGHVDQNSPVPVGVAHIVIESNVLDSAATYTMFWFWANGGPHRLASLRNRVFAMKAIQAMIRRGFPFSSAVVSDIEKLQQAAEDFAVMFPTYGPADVQEKALYASEGSSLAALVNQILAQREIAAASVGTPTPQPRAPARITVPGIPIDFKPSWTPPKWLLPIGGATLAAVSVTALAVLHRRKG